MKENVHVFRDGWWKYVGVKKACFLGLVLKYFSKEKDG